MADAAEWLRRLQVARRRPSRIADGLREPRNIVVGGPLANRLGLQVARTLGDHVAWRLRPTRITDRIAHAAAAIERDGIFVQPDFLPYDEFRRVIAELEQSRSSPYRADWKVTPFGENFEARELFVSDFQGKFPGLMASLRDNALLLQLASAVSRRRMTYRPHVSIFEVFKPTPGAQFTDLDYNQFLHADRHYPFIKAFFYVTDVDEDSAPFTYARGSHRIDTHRLRYEYEYSQAYTRVRRQRHTRTHAQLAMDRALVTLAERYVREIGARVEPIVGKANTLIVANNIGFHKRGPMVQGHRRVTVNIDYKYLESPAQLLYPILRYLYS